MSDSAIIEYFKLHPNTLEVIEQLAKSRFISRNEMISLLVENYIANGGAVHKPTKKLFPIPDYLVERLDELSTEAVRLSQSIVELEVNIRDEYGIYEHEPPIF